jgi:tRNA A22 N-methylase
LAKNAFDVLAKKSKSWMRLGTIVELALDESFSNQYAAGTSHAASNSVCDVGTDHGLLATALAMTNRFDQVLGVDVSEVALREGALTLLNDIRVYRDTTTLTEQPKLPEFRLSDGLQNVHCGEADIVCVAGMGVHTMVDILTAVKTTGTTGSNNTAAPQCWLDVLETRRLILQPTNSRPRLLQHLYRHLHGMGWRARVERIHLVSSRWYFTVELERSNSTVLQIPGALAIATNTSNDAIDWVTHHQKWIHSDSFQTGSVNRDDALWLEEFAAI